MRQLFQHAAGLVPSPAHELGQLRVGDAAAPFLAGTAKDHAVQQPGVRRQALVMEYGNGDEGELTAPEV